MPIVRPPSSGSGGGSSTTTTQVPGLEASGDFDYAAGQAVAAIMVDDVLTCVPCGASDYAQNFVGFLASVPDVGSSPSLKAGRGALITPVVEDGEDLVADEPVFLSMTAGEVTQTVPLTSGTVIVRVGFAVSATEMILNTDFRMDNG